MRARIRGKGKAKTSVRTNWKKWALDATAELREVREQLRLANIAVETARKGEEEARGDVASLSEALTASNAEVLRLSVELEDKAEALQASQVTEEALKAEIQIRKLATEVDEKEIQILTESLDHRTMSYFKAKRKLADACKDIGLRRRAAAVLATMHLQGKSLEGATAEFVVMGKQMGYEVGLLSPASEAYKTAARQIHRMQFSGPSTIAEEYSESAARLREFLSKQLGIPISRIQL